VTNEKIGVLEATQLATDNKLGTMEASVAHIDNSLAALLRRFDDLMTQEHDRHQGHNNNNNNNNNNTHEEQVKDNCDEYSADSEHDDHDALCPSIIAMAGVAIDDVIYATMMMLFIKSSLKCHFLMANMILMLIFLGNWLLAKNLHALNFLKMLGLEQPLVNSLILLLFGGWNMARNILMT
jgi:hypothetical protein